MSAGPITLWLPKPPDNANGRQHWAVANRAKKRHWAELTERMQFRINPTPPKEPLQRVEIRAEWYAKRAQWAPDKDNIIRRLKPTIDWLVANDYLAGDTAAHVSWADPIVHVGVTPPLLCTVRLTLTPLAA